MIELSEFRSVRLEGHQTVSDSKIYCSLEAEQEASTAFSSLTVETRQSCFPLAEGLYFPRSYLYMHKPVFRAHLKESVAA